MTTSIGKSPKQGYQPVPGKGRYFSSRNAHQAWVHRLARKRYERIREELADVFEEQASRVAALTSAAWWRVNATRCDGWKWRRIRQETTIERRG